MKKIHALIKAARKVQSTEGKTEVLKTTLGNMERRLLEEKSVFDPLLKELTLRELAQVTGLEVLVVDKAVCILRSLKIPEVGFLVYGDGSGEKQWFIRVQYPENALVAKKFCLTCLCTAGCVQKLGDEFPGKLADILANYGVKMLFARHGERYPHRESSLSCIADPAFENNYRDRKVWEEISRDHGMDRPPFKAFENMEIVLR